MHDVYAYGVVAPSTLIELRDGYPPAGGYSEIAGIHPSLGGEAAGSAYALARLGISVKLEGNRLGQDAESTRVIDLLTTAGVDCTGIVTAGTSPVDEIILAYGSERTVLGTYGQLLNDRAWVEPSQDAIGASRVVCVDPFFDEQSHRVSRWSRDADVPQVTVDTSPGSEMANHAAVLVLSEEYIRRTLDVTDPQRVLARYTAEADGLVIVTGGSGPLWYARRDETPRSWTPFAITARDTTGAGDSFRAGVIYGLLHGYTDEQLIRTAGAISALVCQRPPGVLHSPTIEEVGAFLDSNS